MSHKIRRNFDRCPRCKAPMVVSTSFSGSPSEFFRECTKCHTYVDTYIPMPHQEAVHKDNHRIIGNVGGYGTGKTTTSRKEVQKHYLLTPNANILIGANITPQYEQTIKRELEKDIPAAWVAAYSNQKSHMDLINGARIMYRPFDDEGKLRSLNLTMYVMVEASETSGAVFHQLKTRHRNMAATAPKLDVLGNPVYRERELPTGETVLMPVYIADWRKAIIESNPDAGWLSTDLLLKSSEIIGHGKFVQTDYNVSENDKDPSIATHIAESSVNYYLPDSWLSENTKNKPDWWIKRYIYGSFAYSEGLVYPNAVDCVIQSFKVPAHWKRLIAFDYGLSDLAVYGFGAVDEENGILHIYKEIIMHDLNVDSLAERFHESVKDIPFGGLYTQPIIDPKSGVKRDYNKKDLVTHFAEKGINFKPGQISVDARVMKLNTYIASGRIKIHDCCTHLIGELKGYKFPERSLTDTKSSMKPVDKNNHAINTIEWIVMELPDKPTQLTNLAYNYKGQVIKDNRLTDDLWQLSDDLEDRYLDPSPYNINFREVF